jgi:hypothetical protein
MGTIVIVLALTVMVILVALLGVLAVLRAGIRRQERAACFTCHPPGLSTAIARRVLGLYARGPGCVEGCHQASCTPGPIPNGPSPLPAQKESAT